MGILKKTIPVWSREEKAIKKLKIIIQILNAK